MIAGVMQLEANLAGNIKPDRDLFFLAGRGIAFRQPRQHLAVQEMAEEIGFGGFRDIFQIIDLAAAPSVDHELAVVFEGGEVHSQVGLPDDAGGGRRKACASRSMAARICRCSFTKAARDWRTCR